jgi:hypothetical protein
MEKIVPLTQLGAEGFQNLGIVIVGFAHFVLGVDRATGGP